MKICFVTPEFVRKGKVSTGLPNYLCRVSKALQLLGHTPIILTDGDVTEHTYYEGIEVYRRNCSLHLIIKNKSVNYFMKAVKMSFLLNEELEKICRENEIDIVQFSSLYGLGMFYQGKVPAITRLSSYAKKSFEKSTLYSKTEIAVQSWVERIAVHHTAGIISPSNVMAQAYAADTGRKVTVIETPFVNDIIECNDEIYQKLCKGKKYILFFGTLLDIKGIYVIIKQIRQFLQENPDYYFAVIGNNFRTEEQNPVQKLYQEAGAYKDRIIYSKALKHEYLYPILRHAELIVLPSLMDNLPNACIEAMSYGKIVVGTEGASFEQLIKDGKNGFLAQPGDAKDLYKKIMQALQLSQGERDNMENMAKARIKRLAPEIVVKRLEHYYDTVISKCDRR